MNLISIYGPIVTLKELCQILKIGRSTYYQYIDEEHHLYKPNLPPRLLEYSNNKFLTSDVEKYLSPVEVK